MPSPGEHPALPIYEPPQVDVIKNTVNELRLKSIRRPEEKLVESHLHAILSNRGRNLVAPESQEKMGIAIYGESGSGKSFMLRRLMKKFPHLTEAAAGHRPFVSVRLKGPVRLQTAGYQVALLLDLQRAPDLGASSGPQQMFGRIYQWLEFGSEDHELEPVQTMLRDHIVETLPVGPGDTVLGQEVQQRRIHSIRSAALQHGVHQKTTQKVLTLAGIARAERDDQSDNQILFPSEMADALMARIARGIPMKEIHAYLEISRTHLKHLVAEGYIKPILDIEGLDPLYDTTDLDAFVEEISVKSETVQLPTSDQVSLAEAVRRACCSVVEVLNLVWRQGLDWSGKLESGRGYGALLVSLEEVRTKTQLPALDGIVTQRISKDFGIPSEAAQAIVQSGFLRTVDAINPKNRCPVKLIPHEEYRRFTDTYISLRDVSRDRGMWSRHLIPELEAARIYPLPEWKDFGGYIYRRDQVT